MPVDIRILLPTGWPPQCAALMERRGEMAGEEVGRRGQGVFGVMELWGLDAEGLFPQPLAC